MTRKVFIVTAKGNHRLGDNAVTIPTTVLTLKELFPYLKSNGVQYEDMKIILVPGNFTLEHQDSILPEGDFWLSLTPVKTKAGADYIFMKSFIRDKRATAVSNKDGEIVELIGDYTRLTKHQMTTLYDRLQHTNSDTITVAENQNTHTDVVSLLDQVVRLKAEVIRLITKVNRIIDEHDELEEEVYEELEDDDMPSGNRVEAIPEEMMELQEWAKNN